MISLADVITIHTPMDISMKSHALSSSTLRKKIHKLQKNLTFKLIHFSSGNSDVQIKDVLFKHILQKNEQN